jgi:hypothetical protein
MRLPVTGRQRARIARAFPGLSGDHLASMRRGVATALIRFAETRLLVAA